jgi:hypothetical protein
MRMNDARLRFAPARQYAHWDELETLLGPAPHRSGGDPPRNSGPWQTVLYTPRVTNTPRPSPLAKRSSDARSDYANAPRISAPSCGCCAGNSVSAGWQSHRCDVGHSLVEAWRSRQVPSRERTRSRPAPSPLRAGCRSASRPLRSSRSPQRHPVIRTVICAGTGLVAPVRLTRCACCCRASVSPTGCACTGIDQDEQQEYAGRFCDYLDGTSVPIRNVADAEVFAFGQLANPDVVIWDLHESDERDRGAIFAALKLRLVDHLLACPGRAAFIVDEGVTVTEDDLGCAHPGGSGAPRPALRSRGARAYPACD